ncbi:MAG: hypothetical protein OXR62_10790 [Ahrensia sp.]|nr:hypothetical protein [Ahrensia sp.]
MADAKTTEQHCGDLLMDGRNQLDCCIAALRCISDMCGQINGELGEINSVDLCFLIEFCTDPLKEVEENLGKIHQILYQKPPVSRS